MLAKNCSQLACHGATARYFRIYARNRLRDDNDEAGRNAVMREAERAHNYDAARAFVDLAHPDRSLLLRKPLEQAADGLFHRGATLYGGTDVFPDPTDPEYQVIAQWIDGATEVPDVPGTRQQLVAIAIAVVASLAWARPAAAFHNGKLFDRAAGGGGGGGLFYTGSRRERGWDCTACHVDPRNKLQLDVSSQPPELIAEQRYAPGASYTITIAMANPGAQLGLAATRSNFNAMVITTIDDAGAPAGTFSGFDAGKFFARGTSILASDSTMVNETSWTFTWTAPAAPAGPITIDLGVVDGDGAGQTTQTTLTDPLGDDTAMRHYVVADAGSARRHTPPRSTGWAGLLAIVPLLAVLGRRRRRGAMLAACRSPSSAPASSD